MYIMKNEGENENNKFLVMTEKGKHVQFSISQTLS